MNQKKPVGLFVCPTCSKRFGRKGDLGRHEKLHTGARPHVCSDCGKAFAQFSGLKTHLNVHTRVRPFACNFEGCGKCFGDPSSRARHRKETHERVGAFKCPFPKCKSSIKRRSAFTSHLRKHNLDPLTVDVDDFAPAQSLMSVKSTSPKSIRGSTAESLPVQPHNTVVKHQFREEFYNHVLPIPQYPHFTHTPPSLQAHGYHSIFPNDWLQTPSQDPRYGIYTLNGSPSDSDFTPNLTFSSSPSRSPSPPVVERRTPSPEFGVYTPQTSAPRAFAPSPHLSPLPRDFPTLYFPEPVKAAHSRGLFFRFDVRLLTTLLPAWSAVSRLHFVYYMDRLLFAFYCIDTQDRKSVV